METVFEYFMRETGKKMEDMQSDIKDINNKLSDLTKFKIEMIASARMTSLIVSIICGFLTLLASLWTVGHAKY